MGGFLLCLLIVAIALGVGAALGVIKWIGNAVLWAILAIASLGALGFLIELKGKISERMAARRAAKRMKELGY